MNALRNWLLGIMKQAIREDREIANGTRLPQYADMVGLDKIKNGQTSPAWHEGEMLINSPNFEELWKQANIKRAVPRYDEPVSFEDEQNQALKAQDEFWAKKVPSDV